MREGKLFQVETEYFPNADPHTPAESHRHRGFRRVEYYWLCDQCAPYLTLTFDQKHGIATVPLPDGTGRKLISKIPPERHAPSEPNTDAEFASAS
jgi:hypothetical protein